MCLHIYIDLHVLSILQILILLRQEPLQLKWDPI